MWLVWVTRSTAVAWRLQAFPLYQLLGIAQQATEHLQCAMSMSAALCTAIRIPEQFNPTAVSTSYLLCTNLVDESCCMYQGADNLKNHCFVSCWHARRVVNYFTRLHTTSYFT